jgi:thiamine pyrophosphate-dependent acetolactate synthase large subunit-like protein
MKVHSAVAKALRAYGITTVFGLMGDANMLTLIDFMGPEGGRYVPCVHEGGAVSMADGFARMSGGPGVASVTHGPGLTNTLTALTEAVRARSPVVVMAADTPATRDFAQSIDMRAFATAAGAAYRRVLSPDHAVDDVCAALAGAQDQRMPVVLDIPVGLQETVVDYAPSGFRAGPGPAVGPDQGALERATGIIATARRPVILAGRGAALAAARDDLVQLADMIGAPVATTLLGKDFFRGYPFDLGVIGTVGTDLALEIVAKSDCVVAFGASLGRYTTADGSLFRGKALIQCDIDQQGMGRVTAATAEVTGDAGAVAREMARQLAELGSEPTKFRTRELGEGISIGPAGHGFEDRSTQDTVDARTAMIRLDELLPEDRVVVTGCGRFTRAPWRYLHVREPADFTHTASFASIGLGIATTIGASIARPGRLTVGIEGDGGAMMGLTELSTAVRENVPMVMVIINDGSYGSEYGLLQGRGLDPRHSLMAWPEFADVARALGGEGIAIRSLEDLNQAADLLRAPTGPLLLDIKVDPAVKNAVDDHTG